MKRLIVVLALTGIAFTGLNTADAHCTEQVVKLEKAKVLISNVPATYTQVDIIMLLQPYGQVSNIQLDPEAKTATIEMDVEDCKKAIAGLNGKVVDGAKLGAKMI